jgi:hypothetical protein
MFYIRSLIGRRLPGPQARYRRRLDMHFEVVTHQTLHEGIRYHGRFKVDDSDAIIWAHRALHEKGGRIRGH